MTVSPLHAHTLLSSAIRPITGRDIPQVVQLLNLVFSPTLDAESRRALQSMAQTGYITHRMTQFAHRISSGFIFETNNEVMGNVSVIPSREKGRIIIANVAVHPDLRRQGIARELMEVAIDHVRARGKESIILQVDVDNGGAIRLYEKLGFDSMGSTRYWTASTGSVRTIHANPSIDVRLLRSGESDQAYALDTASFPLELNWPEAIKRDHYRSGFWRTITNMVNGRNTETWVIDDGKGWDAQLLGLANISSEWGRPHNIALRTPTDERETLYRALLSKCIRRLKLNRRRKLAIETELSDDIASTLLSQANFTSRRQLTTMRLRL